MVYCTLGALDSDLRYSEVPLKGKNKTLVKILGVRQHMTTPAGQIFGVATPATPAALTPMEGLLTVVGLEVTTEGSRTGTGTETLRERVPDF